MKDKPVKQRDNVEVDCVSTKRELVVEKLRWWLAVTILPLYGFLLVSSLLGGIFTDSELLLDCFKAILQYMTPAVGAVYAYYFFKARGAKK